MTDQSHTSKYGTRLIFLKIKNWKKLTKNCLSQTNFLESVSAQLKEQISASYWIHYTTHLSMSLEKALTPSPTITLSTKKDKTGCTDMLTSQK